MTKPVQKRPKPEPFKQAERQWDLKRLYRDLVNADPKRQKLTSMEAVHLRGLLCGYGPAQIADILHKSAHGVESDLSAKVYSRVKSLLAGKQIKNWRDVSQYLEEAGYRKQVDFPLKKLQGVTLPIGTLEGLITINQQGSITINQHPSNNQNNHKVFEINIRLVVPVPEEEKAEDSPSSESIESDSSST